MIRHSRREGDAEVRLIVANDGFGDAGGVQSYLDAVVGALLSRGHEVAMLYLGPIAGPLAGTPMNQVPLISVARDGVEGAFAALARWQPDLCFSHNMADLDIEERLL